MDEFRRPTERTMQVYAESVAAFKGRQGEATPRLDIEELVGLGNRVFEAILELDLSWREAHDDDPDAGSQPIVGKILGLYRGWSASTRDLSAIVARVEARGMVVKGAEALEGNLEVVGPLLAEAGDDATESSTPYAVSGYDPRLGATAEYAA